MLGENWVLENNVSDEVFVATQQVETGGGAKTTLYIHTGHLVVELNKSYFVQNLSLIISNYMYIYAKLPDH